MSAQPLLCMCDQADVSGHTCRMPGLRGSATLLPWQQHALMPRARPARAARCIALQGRERHDAAPCRRPRGLPAARPGSCNRRSDPASTLSETAAASARQVQQTEPDPGGSPISDAAPLEGDPQAGGGDHHRDASIQRAQPDRRSRRGQLHLSSGVQQFTSKQLARRRAPGPGQSRWFSSSGRPPQFAAAWHAYKQQPHRGESNPGARGSVWGVGRSSRSPCATSSVSQAAGDPAAREGDGPLTRSPSAASLPSARGVYLRARRQPCRRRWPRNAQRRRQRSQGSRTQRR